MIERIKNNPFYRNNLVLFVGTLVGSAFNYFFHFIVGRNVEPAVYGEIESLIALLGIISVPAAAFTLIATQSSAAFKANNDIGGNRIFILHLFKKISYYSLPIIAILVILSPQIAIFLNIEKYWSLYLIWFMMLFSFFGAVVSGTLNGWQKFFASSLAGIFGAALKLASVVVFIAFGYLFLGTIASFAIGIIFTFLASLWVLRFLLYGNKREINDNDNLAREHLQSIKIYIWTFMAGNLSLSIMANVDMVIAKHNLDSLGAGNYGALMISAKIIFFLTGMVGTVLFSMSSEMKHKNESTRKLGFEAVRLMLLATAIMTVLYFIFPKLILGLMFGEKYYSVASYLGWFGIVASLLAFNNMFMQYLLSVKKTKITWWLLAISVIMTLTLLVFGKDIITIIIILALAQTGAIFVEIGYLFKGKDNKTIADLYGGFQREN